MIVDVFGRKLDKIEGSRDPPSIGYKLTSDGHFNVENKKLCNVAAAIDNNDAVNLETLTSTYRKIKRDLFDRYLEFEEYCLARLQEINKQILEIKAAITNVINRPV